MHWPKHPVTRSQNFISRILDQVFTIDLVAFRSVVSAPVPVPVPFLWTLDLQFGTEIWDLGLGLGLDNSWLKIIEVLEGDKKSRKVNQGHGSSFPSPCRNIVSALIPVLILWTLDFGLGTWI